ncbi:MAG: FHA domain-containing protein [Planctomycetes bacterium]|nr:FHA domain-containing protein [Planctomycetota bacterium]
MAEEETTPKDDAKASNKKDAKAPEKKNEPAKAESKPAGDAKKDAAKAPEDERPVPAAPAAEQPSEGDREMKLIGIEGFCKDETFIVKKGKSITIGRSRSCDFSFRKCARYLQADPEKRDEDEDFITVSRSHLKLTYAEDGTLSIEDTSSNGTYLSDAKISKYTIKDLDKFCYKLRLGTRETLLVQLGKVTAVKHKPDDLLEDAPTIAEHSEVSVQSPAAEAPAEQKVAETGEKKDEATGPKHEAKADAKPAEAAQEKKNAPVIAEAKDSAEAGKIDAAAETEVEKDDDPKKERHVTDTDKKEIKRFS